MGPGYRLTWLALMLHFWWLSCNSSEIILATCALMMFIIWLEPEHCEGATEASLSLGLRSRWIREAEAALLAWSSWAWLKSWGDNQHSVSWSSFGDEMEDREAKFHSKSWIYSFSLFRKRGVFQLLSIPLFPCPPPLPLITISWQHEEGKKLRDWLIN